jgi:hypothetical protein
MARFVAQMPILGEDVLREYKTWVEGLADEKFEEYLNEFASLSNSVPIKMYEAPKETGVFIAVESFPGNEAPYRYALEARRREASIYYALALWKSYEAKRIESEGPAQFRDQ